MSSPKGAALRQVALGTPKTATMPRSLVVVPIFAIVIDATISTRASAANQLRRRTSA